MSCTHLQEAVARASAGPMVQRRAGNYLLKIAAKRAGLPADFSAHGPPRADASHASERGATLPVVQSTLGHGDIAMTRLPALGGTGLRTVERGVLGGTADFGLVGFQRSR
jgi:site-specific recombinase XerD